MNKHKIKRAIQRIWEILKINLGHPVYEYQKRRWIRDDFTGFGEFQRRNIFMTIASFWNVNRPVKGYYFEFGSYGANTMRMAYDSFRYLFDWTYVAFDSFEGLPEIPEIDKQEIWVKGNLSMTQEKFTRIMKRHGMPRDKLITIKGFYDYSLTDELKKRLLPKKAAVIYIDCDLYTSTVPVLDFIKDFLQKGTIIVFDDWNCFYGDPNRGEKKAFVEFLQRNPSLHFEDFLEVNIAKAFIFTGYKTT